MKKLTEIKVLLKYMRGEGASNYQLDLKLLTLLKDQDIELVAFHVYGSHFGGISGGTTVELKSGCTIQFLIAWSTMISFPDAPGTYGCRISLTDTIDFKRLEQLMYANIRMTPKTEKFIRKYVRGKGTESQLAVYSFIGG